MGGGPMFIPILIWIMSFDTENAVPLSKVSGLRLSCSVLPETFD
jgi:uncharacterized membrane protein YfcA